ncbi:hypothetical protein LTR97_000522 [Elasticomyces elasticus]|uniref:Uncharacterized protein n=1 Tax=Elasticomyces elasticus TaxID=574655 RepID=A0AAN7WHF3_9PEZI|nr:hypothetical protein LTR97_000522 [Elasticomyces elasticus]
MRWSLASGLTRHSASSVWSGVFSVGGTETYNPLTAGAVDIWEHAALLYHAYEWQESIETFRHLVSSLNGDPRVSCAINAGLIQARLGDYTEARQTLEAAAIFDESHVLVPFLLALVEWETGNLSKTKACLEGCFESLRRAGNADYSSRGLDFVLTPDLVHQLLRHLNNTGYDRFGTIKHGMVHVVPSVMPADCIFEAPPRPDTSSRSSTASDSGFLLPSTVYNPAAELAVKLGKRDSNTSRERPSVKVPQPTRQPATGFPIRGSSLRNVVLGTSQLQSPPTPPVRPSRPIHEGNKSAIRRDVLPRHMPQQPLLAPHAQRSVNLESMAQRVNQHVRPLHLRMQESSQSTRPGPSNVETKRPSYKSKQAVESNAAALSLGASSARARGDVQHGVTFDHIVQNIDSKAQPPPLQPKESYPSIWLGARSPRSPRTLSALSKRTVKFDEPPRRTWIDRIAQKLAEPRPRKSTEVPNSPRSPGEKPLRTKRSLLPSFASRRLKSLPNASRDAIAEPSNVTQRPKMIPRDARGEWGDTGELASFIRDNDHQVPLKMLAPHPRGPRLVPPSRELIVALPGANRDRLCIDDSGAFSYRSARAGLLIGAPMPWANKATREALESGKRHSAPGLQAHVRALDRNISFRRRSGGQDDSSSDIGQILDLYGRRTRSRPSSPQPRHSIQLLDDGDSPVLNNPYRHIHTAASSSSSLFAGSLTSVERKERARDASIRALEGHRRATMRPTERTRLGEVVNEPTPSVRSGREALETVHEEELNVPLRMSSGEIFAYMQNVAKWKH